MINKVSNIMDNTFNGYVNFLSGVLHSKEVKSKIEGSPFNISSHELHAEKIKQVWKDTELLFKPAIVISIVAIEILTGAALISGALAPLAIVVNALSTFLLLNGVMIGVMRCANEISFMEMELIRELEPYLKKTQTVAFDQVSFDKTKKEIEEIVQGNSLTKITSSRIVHYLSAEFKNLTLENHQQAIQQILQVGEQYKKLPKFW